MSRLPSLAVSDLDGPAKAMADAITQSKRKATRPTGDFLNAEGALPGPFNAWLHSPEIGQTVQRLGEQLRFESVIPGILRETAILTVAAHWKADYEWWAHARIGRGEGLDDDALTDLKNSQPPSDEDQSVIQSFAGQLLRTGRVSQQSYAAAQELLGDDGVSELVMLIGYYCLVSATLNAFEVPLPEDETKPFET